MLHCYLCGDDFAPNPTGTNSDHVVPLSRGGADEPQNRRPCCEPCNHLKARWSLRRFYERCENVVYDLAGHLRLPDERRARYQRIIDHLDGMLDKCPVYEPPPRGGYDGMPAGEWLRRGRNARYRRVVAAGRERAAELT